jgi:hypothetical protein
MLGSDLLSSVPATGVSMGRYDDVAARKNVLGKRMAERCSEQATAYMPYGLL